MSTTDEFESVKGSGGATWNPKSTGSEKTGDKKDLEAGDKSWITGYFLESKHEQGMNNSTVHMLKIEDVGDKKCINGEVGDDKEVSIWGSFVLDDMFGKVKPGQFIQVKWLGKKPSKTPGRSAYHDWDLGINHKREPMSVGNVANIGNTQAPPVNEVPEASPATAVETDDDPF